MEKNKSVFLIQSPSEITDQPIDQTTYIFIWNNVTVRLIVLNQLIETGSIQTTTYIFIWNNLIVRLIVFNQLIEIGPMQTDPTEQEETSLNMYRADESRSGTIC